MSNKAGLSWLFHPLHSSEHCPYSQSSIQGFSLT